MNRLKRGLLVSLLLSSMFATTVFAEPTVNELRQDKASAQAKIDKLEKEMTTVMSQINEVEKELVEIGQKVIQATADLEAAEEKEKTQHEAMKRRIVAMYENGNTSMIVSVLEAGSIADMLQQAESIKTIHEYDRKQLNEYVSTKEKISSLKVELEEEQARIVKKQKAYESDKKELDGMIAELEKKVDDFDSRIRRAAQAASRPSTSSSNTNYVPPSGTGGGQAIVNAAYQYMGVPYVWGGASSSGVDCSGLVLLAHKAIGVNLAHYSGAQGSGGVAVSRAEAQPGDVVCYSGHVGIYIGNGQMIHAPQTGDVVRVVNVYGSPWFRRYW